MHKHLKVLQQLGLIILRGLERNLTHVVARVDRIAFCIELVSFWLLLILSGFSLDFLGIGILKGNFSFTFLLLVEVFIVHKVVEVGVGRHFDDILVANLYIAVGFRAWSSVASASTTSLTNFLLLSVISFTLAVFSLVLRIGKAVIGFTMLLLLSLAPASASGHIFLYVILVRFVQSLEDVALWTLRLRWQQSGLVSWSPTTSPMAVVIRGCRRIVHLFGVVGPLCILV